MLLGQPVPAVRIEDVGVGAPEGREAVDGVGVDVDGRLGGDGVAREGVRGEGLADRHGDRGDVAEGFAADVVEVGEVVWVCGRQAGRVGARARREEEGVVLFDLRAEAFLYLWVRG